MPSWVKVVNLLMPKSFNYHSHRYMYQRKIVFYSDSKCNSCGLCEKICLSEKIKLVNGKPNWLNEVKCFGCFACINYCPQNAIKIKSQFQFKSYTDANGRYHHPEVTYKDIAQQKVITLRDFNK